MSYKTKQLSLGIILACCFGLILWGCGAKKSSVIASAEQSERYVVVLSLDGFRWDYQSMASTPFLDQMDKEGLSGSFRPCYPSLTFPNHYSMATGLHPNNHGLVGNEFWDEQGRRYRLGDRKAVEDPTFYAGEPLWNTARRAGLRTASFFWVGSETAIGGYQPDRWKKFDSKVPYRDRADSVISWLSLPREERPRLVMWYLEEPDHTGHHHSPEAEETHRMISQVDSVVGYFRNKLSKLPIAAQVDFILVSDHGMATYDPSRLLNLADHLNLDSLEHISAGPFTHIYPRKGYTQTAYNILKQLPGIRVYHKADLPKHLHYGTNPRIGELVVMADLGVPVVCVAKGKKIKTLAAAHGFDNEYKQMHALFKAVGPSFEASRHLSESIPNITLYPLVCRILGIEPAPHDADETLAKSLIKK